MKEREAIEKEKIIKLKKLKKQIVLQNKQIVDEDNKLNVGFIQKGAVLELYSYTNNNDGII